MNKGEQETHPCMEYEEDEKDEEQEEQEDSDFDDECILLGC
jgi:hypothetical protein